MNYQAALIDIGNVLLAFDYQVVFDEVLGELSRDPQAQAKLLSVRDDFECGHCDARDVHARMQQMFGYSGSFEHFAAAWQGIFTPLYDMWDAVYRLKRAGVKLVLFSNINPLHVEDFARYPVFSQFDDKVYSYLSGAMKPALPMYVEAIERVGLQPATTLYIDDMQANLDSAAALGFATLLANPQEASLTAATLLQRILG